MVGAQPAGESAPPSPSSDGGSGERLSSQSGATDDELEDEPLLKYQRMRADVGKLLDGGEEVIRIAMHDTFLAVAMASGTVFLADFHGNEMRRLRPHRCRINDVSVDPTGEFIGTCGDDGNVVISCLQIPESGGGGGSGSDAAGGGGSGAGGGGNEAGVQTFSYRKPMRTVCLDPQYARRRDKLFVAGGDRGELVLNRRGWFSHKETILHEGEGPITATAWRGPLLAWANDQGIKIMDVEREERIAYLDKPRAAVRFGSGGSDGRGCGCHLLWEADGALLVAWADTVMLLHIVVREPAASAVPGGSGSGPGPGGGIGLSVSGGSAAAAAAAAVSARRMASSLLDPATLAPAAPPPRTAEISNIWQADCIICGISPFDAQTLVLLGCAVDDDDGGGSGPAGGGGGSGAGAALRAARAPPEVQLVRRANGEILSADALPLRGWERAGVAAFHLSSMCWLATPPRPLALAGSGGGVGASGGGGGGGGFQLDGTPPAVFLASPNDVVLARMRDVDDQIAWSLQRGDHWGALQAALANRNMLRLHRFEDLLGAYLEDLIDRGLFRDAAGECAALLGDDAMAWERWIYAFARRGQLAAVAPVVPIAAPRLPPAVYEMILEHLLMANPALFLATVKHWGHPRAGVPVPQTSPAGSHGPAMRSQNDIDSAAAAAAAAPAGTSAAAVAAAASGAAGASRIDSLAAGSTGSATAAAGSAALAAAATAKVSALEEEEGHEEELYSLPLVMARIEAALARRADPLLAEAQAELLVMDGQYDRAVDVYLSLADQAPPLPAPAAAAAAAASAGGGGGGGGSGEAGSGPGGDSSGGSSGGGYEQVFRLIQTHGLWSRALEGVRRLVRLDRVRAGELLLRYVDKLPVAGVVQRLRAAGRRDLLDWYLHLLFTQAPELYGAPEYAQFHVMQVSLHAEFAPPFVPGRNAPYDSDFLSFLRGSPYAPLELALSECERRRPPLYDEMVYILGKLGSTRRALGLLLERIGNVRRAIEFVESHDKELWYQLIDYSLRNEAFLTGLLDHAGVYNVDLARLVSEVPEGMRIHGLRGKLIKILNDYGFQVALHEACKSSLRADCLTKLRTLNQRQRKALRIDAAASCSYHLCGLPLAGPPAGFRPVRGAIGGSSGAVAASGGRGSGGSGMYVFACGHSFHAHCLMVGAEGAVAAEVRAGARGAVVDCAACASRQRARPPP